MSRRAIGGLAVALAVLASPVAAQVAQPRYTSLTVFGDSLVDAGNIRTLGFGANPAQGYFNGRFTNGYDYTDLLSLRLYGTATVASLQGGTNFAFGGARATTTSNVPDLVEQLGLYSGYLATGKAVDPNGLYVLNFGGNDIFAAQAAGAPTGFASDSAFLMNAATTYAGGIQTLSNLGARNFLITGFPVATGDGLSLSIEAEGYLSTALGNLNLAPGSTLYRFSYLDFFQKITTNPTAYGLPANLIQPDPTRADGGTCQGAAAFPACTGYFSFDGIHPTAAVQQAAFNEMNRQFNLTGAVPEPSMWLMMIVGAGAVGFAMRRRARVVTTVRFA
ncbi:PEPxxWA-CTERM sorting domain-containing protein [Sphingomonas sp. A2-49]|uniref:SGNH/GDSL hydrolase family protein n=1 Tax=Sphingomonas sp. A2-49 TaxID=1391375 RepID=UPI0021D134CA|nr:SGNH/GDSL hydrolase family protein [Sphingomonas sp. A2-49]MCU6454135.1 PEPxxWA-CTERM sorting domain-containing protein [Sphingomonas sp. A2-49]